MMRRCAGHRGATLVELILYMGILALVAVLTIPLLFTTAENRMLQQTIAIVELNGTQTIQTVTLSIRAAERILYPPIGGTGSFLALQMADELKSPIIFGIDNGRMTKIQHDTREMFTSTQVAVEDFVVRNTSVDDDHHSVAITFRVSRTIRLEQPRSYRRDFETAVSLSPVDIPIGNACGCTVPSCANTGAVLWKICPSGVCWEATTTLVCE
jgi:type II secretory pathway pseudopilin PulG